MTVLRAIARPMVASIFVIQGYETFRRPDRVASRAEPVVRPLAERIPAVPAKTEDAVRLNGAVQMAAGLLLALAGSRGCPRSHWPRRWYPPPRPGTASGRPRRKRTRPSSESTS